MRIGSNDYKLILLDTNAIREIIANTSNAGKGFFTRFFLESSKYAPCFSIYNLIELLPYRDIFEKFVNYFSIIPCIMLYPYKTIISQEYSSYCNNGTMVITKEIANVFTPLVDNDSYNFKKFINRLENDYGFTEILRNEIDEFCEIASRWKLQRIEAKESLQKLSLPSTLIDEKYYLANESEAIVRFLNSCELNSDSTTNIYSLPSARLMQYSHFNRIHLTSKDITKNDIMDIMISCIIPYVDAVITEAFQADVYKKAKKIIPQIQDLEIYTLRDIRLNK